MSFDGNAYVPAAGLQVLERLSSSSSARILLIEDDQEIAEEVANELVDRAYMVIHARDRIAGCGRGPTG